jgi:hypothetical protein
MFLETLCDFFLFLSSDKKIITNLNLNDFNKFLLFNKKLFDSYSDLYNNLKLFIIDIILYLNSINQIKINNSKEEMKNEQILENNLKIKFEIYPLIFINFMNKSPYKYKFSIKKFMKLIKPFIDYNNLNKNNNNNKNVSNDLSNDEANKSQLSNISDKSCLVQNKEEFIDCLNQIKKKINDENRKNCSQLITDASTNLDKENNKNNNNNNNNLNNNHNNINNNNKRKKENVGCKCVIF